MLSLRMVLPMNKKQLYRAILIQLVDSEKRDDDPKWEVVILVEEERLSEKLTTEFLKEIVEEKTGIDFSIFNKLPEKYKLFGMLSPFLFDENGEFTIQTDFDEPKGEQTDGD